MFAKKSRLIGFLLAVTGLGASAHIAHARIIYKNDFEEGNYSGVRRQYQDHTCRASNSYLDNGLFKIVTSPVRSGNYALRHKIENCDERSELVVPAGLLKADNEYWIGWSYFIPRETSKTGLIQQMGYHKAYVDQWDGKTLFECNQWRDRLQNGRPGLRTQGSPGSDLAFSVRDQQFRYKIKFYKGKVSHDRNVMACKTYSFSGAVERWQDFVMHLKPSSRRNGFVKIWRNGELVVDFRGPLMPPGVKAMGSWKIGSYTGDPGNGKTLLFTDELKVGDHTSSYQEVAPRKTKFE